MIRQSLAARNASLDAWVDLVNAGSGPGTLKLYTGGQPATGDTAETGTLLVTFTLADPAFAPADAGVKVLDADPDINADAIADGTAGWARVEDSTGANVFDGTVGATGSGQDFIINTTALANGQTVSLTSGTITAP